jgi:CyaY protein
MDESTYQRLADETLRRIEDAFKEIDPDDVDCEYAGDVMTLTFRQGKRCVLNTQRPTRQLWLAANARAWHFTYDETKRAWLDDKGQGIELFAQVAQIVKETAGVAISIG